MSTYYRYNFISPDKLYAQVKEELRSYMESGTVDDALFPKWTNQCLQKLGMSSYPILPYLLNIQNYTARLPDGFHAIREAWGCSIWQESIQNASSLYQQVTDTTNVLITSRMDVGQMSKEIACDPCPDCPFPNMVKAIYKTTNTEIFTFRKEWLLTPGNINTACPKDLWCANWNSACEDSYDIRDNKFVTTFCEGLVYILYYSDGIDENDEQLIPDNYYIEEFIKAFLKQKLFEQIFNQTTDETFNQSQQKYTFYKQLSDEAYILADTENKKETVYRKMRAIKRTNRRNDRYDLDLMQY